MGEWIRFDPNDKSTWPKHGEEVLATIWENVVMIVQLEKISNIFGEPTGRYKWSSDCFSNEDIDEVSAWMPVPKPYIVEEEMNRNDGE